MLTRIRSSLTYANVIATTALFVALGGTSYAVATGSVDSRAIKNNSVGSKDIRNNQVSTTDLRNNSTRGRDIRNNSVTGADILESSLGKVGSAANADNATNATNATNSSNLGGAAADTYQKYGATLPSGRSMSGDYGIRTPNTGTSGFLALSVSFPIPLATRIPAARIVYTGPTGTTNCSGPGNAAAGYLCIYQINSGGVNTPPSVFAFENQSPQNESGNFGFNMEWGVTGAQAFSIGTWTVTAP